MNAVILNSRQSKICCGVDEWIVKTIDAVNHAVSNGYTILTSVGYKTWEMVLYLALRNGADVKVVVPCDADIEKLFRDFEISDRSKINFLKLHVSETHGKYWWTERDKFIIDRADVIYLVSVRNNSVLSKLLVGKPNKSILMDFLVPYRAPRKMKTDVLTSAEIDPELDVQLSDCLIHWTHTFYEPWPGETKAQFYDSIINSGGDYSHSAYNTLRRILLTRKVYGVHRTSGTEMFVSFTGAGIRNSVELMSWRKGMVRLYWEPYGIAVKRDLLVSLGAVPVTYVDLSVYKSLPFEKRSYFQPAASKHYNWTHEMEWRILGDFQLSDDVLKECIVLTKKRLEAEQIKREFNTVNVAFLKEG